MTERQQPTDANTAQTTGASSDELEGLYPSGFFDRPPERQPLPEPPPPLPMALIVLGGAIVALGVYAAISPTGDDQGRVPGNHQGPPPTHDFSGQVVREVRLGSTPVGVAYLQELAEVNGGRDGSRDASWGLSIVVRKNGKIVPISDARVTDEDGTTITNAQFDQRVRHGEQLSFRVQFNDSKGGEHTAPLLVAVGTKGCDASRLGTQRWVTTSPGEVGTGKALPTVAGIC